jgi:hypothetical protein
VADAGLFIGWGAPVRGREAKGLEVFSEALSYFGRLEQSAAIGGFDVALLAPHGGDLAGFLLVRGSDEQIATLRASDEFARLTTRAGLIVERFGIVEAVLGDDIGAQVARAQEAIAELA